MNKLPGPELEEERTGVTLRLESVRAQDGVATGELGPAALVLWREEVTDARFHAMREGLMKIAKNHERMLFLMVIEPTAAPPGDELRRESARLLQELSPTLMRFACVIEGTGFRTAMIRAVVGGIEALRTSRTFPTRYFADVSPALAWLTDKDAALSDALGAGVSSLRARLARAPLA